MRDIRTGAGLSARRLTELTGQHYTRVSETEDDVQVPTEPDIHSWCAACSARDRVEDLILSARSVDSTYVELRRQSRAGMRRVLGAHTIQRYERTAVFRVYEHNVVPGLFQTDEYAAMFSFWIDFLDTPTDLDAAVAARAERQRVLQRGAHRVVALPEEQALRTWFGTTETQIGQLGRLLELMSLPNVSLGVIP